jgi:FixJ family two-component response regulator
MNDTSNALLANVHVIDDDDSFRISMVRLLKVAGFSPIGYRCAGEFLLAQGTRATGCILLDISMPGPSGIELLEALVRRDSSPPIIFVTGSDDIRTSVGVMKAGALDYVVKPVSAVEILAKIRTALCIDAEHRQARDELSQLRARFAALTRTERAIFYGVLGDRLNKQLAFELGTCERTIKAQRARMLDKLQIHSIPELVRVAKLLEGAGDRTVRMRSQARPAPHDDETISA